jgi:hypothetical protein
VASRTGEKIFGVLDFVGGVGILLATALGARPGPLVLGLAAAVVVGWLVYYLRRRRRASHAPS